MALIGAIQRQRDIVAAVMLRDIRTRFGKSRFGYLWAFAEPLVHMTWIVTMSYFLARSSPYGFSRAVFVASGLLPLFIFIHTSNRVAATTSSISGFSSLSIDPISIIVARAILEVLTMVVVMLVVFTALYQYGFEEAMPRHLDVILQSFVFFILLGIGFGLVNGVISRFFPMWRVVWSLGSRATIFFSGVIRIIDFYPPDIRELAAYNPLLHAVTLVRVGFYGDHYPQIIFDFDYMVYFTLGCLFIGLCADRVFRHRLQR